jgi:uncharacterized protein
MKRIECMNADAAHNPDAPTHCDYCNARLDVRYYFCTGCGKPYQNEERVIPQLPSPVLSTETLMRLKAPQAMKMFWVFFSVVIGTAIISHFAFGLHRPDLGFMFQMSALFGITCVYGAMNFGTLWPQLKNHGIGMPALLGLLSLIPLLFINYHYHQWFMGLTDNMKSPSDAMREYNLDHATLIFGMCVFPAITEEIAFRGLLQNWLTCALPARKALIVASALFTAMHFSVVSAPYLFMVGMVLGWMNQRNKSLYPSMLVHFLHNFIVVEYFHL